VAQSPRRQDDDDDVSGGGGGGSVTTFVVLCRQFGTDFHWRYTSFSGAVSFCSTPQPPQPHLITDDGLE